MANIKQEQLADEVLENKIRNSKEIGVETDVLVYNLTKNFQVTELHIRKRITLLKRLKIVDDFDGLLVWRENIILKKNTEDIQKD